MKTRHFTTSISKMTNDQLVAEFRSLTSDSPVQYYKAVLKEINRRIGK